MVPLFSLFLTDISLWGLELPCPTVKWFDVDKSKGLGLLILWCGEEREKKEHEQPH